MHDRKEVKRAYQVADKMLRKRKYSCLVPSCANQAINCHSVPESSIRDALAVNGHVYTLNPSFMQAFNTHPAMRRDIRLVGIDNAGIFKGYCNEHDTRLFEPAETDQPGRRRGLYFASLLRAVSLEYCRKRSVRDFFKAVYEQVPLLELREEIEAYENTVEVYKQVMLTPMLSDGPDSFPMVDFNVTPFPGNLGVSCCGVFQQNPQDIFSFIGYNLISESDLSYLILTAPGHRSPYITQFLEEYDSVGSPSKMVNDIAFFRGEEPIISPLFWNSLSRSKKSLIERSLVHPAYRTQTESLDVIQLPKTKNWDWNYLSEKFQVDINLIKT